MGKPFEICVYFRIIVEEETFASGKVKLSRMFTLGISRGNKPRMTSFEILRGIKLSRFYRKFAKTRKFLSQKFLPLIATICLSLYWLNFIVAFVRVYCNEADHNTVISCEI